MKTKKVRTRGKYITNCTVSHAITNAYCINLIHSFLKVFCCWILFVCNDCCL